MGAAEWDITAPAQTRVLGRVTFMDVPVPAGIAFRRLSPVAGRPLDPLRTTTVAEPGDGPDGAPFDYSVYLERGATYDAEIQPNDDTLALPDEASSAPARTLLPPLTLRFTVPSTGPDRARANLEYPASLAQRCTASLRSACRLSGVVRSAAVSGPNPTVSGLTVRAIDAVSGAVVSSTDRTVDGRFTVRIAPTSARYLLEVSGVADDVATPTVTFDPALFFPGDQDPVLLVPAVSEVRRTVAVRTTDGTPAPAANVRFSGTDVGSSPLNLYGTFVAAGVTSSDASRLGELELPLLPGAYSVRVVPGQPVRAAVLETALTVGSGDDTAGEPIVLTLPVRSRLVGTVRDPNGRAIVAANVDALARRVGAQPSARSSHSTTDPTGRFSLDLDGGRYDLVIKPPDNTGYGWLVVAGVEIGTGVERSASYSVAAPVVVRGTLRDQAGVPLAGAVVRAYALVGPTGSIQIGSGSDKDALGGEREGVATDEAPATYDLLVGQASSDASGHYELLLPQAL